jgi:hypothetical protein
VKYPILLPYVHTQDDGKELKYCLRSLENIKNWNGNLYMIGDLPSWINKSEIKHVIPSKRMTNPYLDVANKIYECFINPELPDNFIFMNDDIYITEPISVSAYNSGNIPDVITGMHKSSLYRTKIWLRKNGYNTLNYDTHTPMVINKEKWLKIYEVNKSNQQFMQWRSLYGNINGIESEFMTDKKTRTNKLMEGKIISTLFYTDELKKMFPIESRFKCV